MIPQQIVSVATSRLKYGNSIFQRKTNGDFGEGNPWGPKSSNRTAIN